MYSGEPLSHFVDAYLDYLYEAQPTSASLDGIHTHDDLLEDLSQAAIETQARDLGGMVRRLGTIAPSTLTPTEQLEQRMLESHIQARIFALEDARAWQRSPRGYTETIATSLSTQILCDHAPLAERARRVLSKLRQAPRVIEAAQANVKEPPGIYVKEGLSSVEALLGLLERDLPRAFADVDDLSLLGDLADASNEASAAIRRYDEYLRTDLAPKARASFRMGRERFERKLQLDEGITLGAEQLLAIGLRELKETQEAFRRVASQLKGSESSAWAHVRQAHPEADGLVAAATEQVEALRAFVQRSGIVTVPSDEPVTVMPTPGLPAGCLARMWVPGPFEAKPLRSYYYLAAIDPRWPPERRQAHLQDLNLAALSSITMYEVFPGHCLRFQHVQRVESKLRKSTLLMPQSFVEGWAHYGQHLTLESGYAEGDATIALGQLAETLVRLARLVVGIRLHADDLSVEQGVRFFRDEAFLEEGQARQEAERGTFDPGYVVCAIGRLMLLKLREDYRALHQGKFSLREFHDELLGQGAAPFWLHRRLMLGDDRTSPLE